MNFKIEKSNHKSNFQCVTKILEIKSDWQIGQSLKKKKEKRKMASAEKNPAQGKLKKI